MRGFFSVSRALLQPMARQLGVAHGRSQAMRIEYRLYEEGRYKCSIKQSVTSSIRMSTTLSGLRLANLYDLSLMSLLEDQNGKALSPYSRTRRAGQGNRRTLHRPTNKDSLTSLFLKLIMISDELSPKHDNNTATPNRFFNLAKLSKASLYRYQTYFQNDAPFNAKDTTLSLEAKIQHHFDELKLDDKAVLEKFLRLKKEEGPTNVMKRSLNPTYLLSLGLPGFPSRPRPPFENIMNPLITIV